MLFESFKMTLYQRTEDQKDGNIRDKLTSRNGRQLQTSKVFVEALKFIKQTIFQTFAKNGVKINEIKDIQWILAVPAIWSDRAKHKMERWAKTAGLIDKNIYRHLRIVYEPDCASISCQYETGDEDQKSFQSGDRYILIDAGGGTVDVACHQVKREFEMEEIYYPTGGPWGGDFIDNYFDELLDEIFGKGAIETFRTTYPANYTMIMENFRKQKMKFYDNPDVEFLKVALTSEFKTEIVEYSASKYPQIATNTDDFESIIQKSRPFDLEAGKHLKCTDNDLCISLTIWKKHLFDKVIDPTIAHVQDLIEKVNKVRGRWDDENSEPRKLKYLCIAGGLAANRYFQHRIYKAFGKGSKHDLLIRTPRRPILSVIDGALRLGLRPNYIKTRRVKYTYGIAIDRSEKNVDKDRLPEGYLDKNLYIHPTTHKRTVRNLFSAFIKKNEPVDLNEAIVRRYRRFHKNVKAERISIYYSAKADPYVIEEDQKPLASVTITFPDEFQGLSFTVQFFFGDTNIRANVLCEDQKSNQNDGKQILMRELELDFNDLYA